MSARISCSLHVVGFGRCRRRTRTNERSVPPSDSGRGSAASDGGDARTWRRVRRAQRHCAVPAAEPERLRADSPQDSPLSNILPQARASEWPSGAGREKVAIRETGGAGRRNRRASSEHMLAHHELAVVLADQPLQRLQTGIREIGTRGPLPCFTKQLTRLAFVPG